MATRNTYRTKLQSLSRKEPEDPQDQSDWAKYLCVLTSGYLEQAIKEILLEFSARHQALQLQNYIERTWPESRNMKCSNIKEILCHFDDDWGKEFLDWLSANSEYQYKEDINAIVADRNRIAHGEESNTNHVTLRSMRARLPKAFALVEFIESLALSEDNLSVEEQS